MSRIGKKPIAIPKGVTIKADASGVDVKGPKGQMKQALPPGITAAVEDGNARHEEDLGRRASWTSSTAWRAAW